MASTLPFPSLLQELPPVPTAPPEAAAEQMPAHESSETEAGALAPRGSAVARLPVELDVAIPVRKFRVRNLLTLALGQLIETQWAHGEDMPLAAGDVQLAWSEFEVIDTQLAVRVTRLA